MTRNAFTAVLLAIAAGAPAAFAAEPAETDIAALRYFLSIGDEASVAAEIERLETEFPGADIREAVSLLDARAAEVDTSPIWRKIEADDHAAARELIARLSEDNPDWTPPEDMMVILDGREGQARFDAAYAAGDLAGAVETLTAFPVILTCDRVNNPWRLAELQRNAGRDGDALATYEGVLRTCGGSDHVVATLQKAHELGDREGLERLLTVARERNPALGERLTALEAEFGEVANQPTAPAAAASAPAPAADPKRYAGPAARPAAPASRRAEPARAPASGALDKARAAADRQDWAGCLEATTSAQTAAALNQRAWCALNFGRANEAIAGFGAVAAGPAEAGLVRDATYGMILGYAQVGRLNDAAHLAARAELTREQRAVVSRTVLSKLALQSFNAGRHRHAVEYLDRLSRETGSLDRGLAMLRGWALLKSGKKSAAREQFQRIHAASPGKDSHEGIVETR